MQHNLPLESSCGTGSLCISHARLACAILAETQHMQVHCYPAWHLQQVCRHRHSLHMVAPTNTRPALAVPSANLLARAQHHTVRVHTCELLGTCLVQSMSDALSVSLAHQ